MEKIWLKSYPPGVPHDVKPEQYRSVAHLLEESFRKHASSPFSVCMDQWMTYGELDRRSAALGAYLQSLGLEPGARVAIMLPNIPQFGVTMAADYFRRRGWVIDLRTGMTHHDLIGSVPAESYPVIGLSAGSARMIFPLARLIVALRISNPASWIMVSGKITDVVPDIVGLVDADGMAGDAETALEQMRAHVETAGQLAAARN